MIPKRSPRTNVPFSVRAKFHKSLMGIGPDTPERAAGQGASQTAAPQPETKLPPGSTKTSSGRPKPNA